MKVGDVVNFKKKKLIIVFFAPATAFYGEEPQDLVACEPVNGGDLQYYSLKGLKKSKK